MAIIYSGHVLLMEEHSLDSWVVPGNYICNGPFEDDEFDSTLHEYHSVATFNLREIEKVEFFYDSQTNYLS